MLNNMADPRVRKTRRSLQEALVRLILRQGYDSISIQDIATEAETARVTFYRHYRDKEELLMDCLNALYEELAQQTEPVSAAGVLAGHSPVTVLYRHMEAHEDLYRILFSGRGMQTVIERLRHHMAMRAVEAMQQLPQIEQVGVPLELIATHVAGAQIGLAIWWLMHDKPYPASYMAQISLWLSLTGLLQTLGLGGFQPPMPPLP